MGTFSLRQPPTVWLSAALVAAIVASVGEMLGFEFAVIGHVGPAGTGEFVSEVGFFAPPVFAAVLGVVLPWSLATKGQSFTLTGLALHILYLVICGSFAALVGVAGTFFAAPDGHEIPKQALAAVAAVVISWLVFALASIARDRARRVIYFVAMAILAMLSSALLRQEEPSLQSMLHEIVRLPDLVWQTGQVAFSIAIFGVLPALLFAAVAYSLNRRP